MSMYKEIMTWTFTACIIQSFYLWNQILRITESTNIFSFLNLTFSDDKSINKQKVPVSKNRYSQGFDLFNPWKFTTDLIDALVLLFYHK